MSDWSKMARSGAAHEFGRRHYRAYALGQYGGRLAAVVGSLVALAVAGGGVVWLLGHAPAPMVWLGAAAVLFAATVLRVVWLLSPASRARTGSGIGIVVLVLAAIGCVVAAAMTG
jgi:hypothetical protein